MKKLMFSLVAALSLAVMAQDAECGKGGHCKGEACKRGPMAERMKGPWGNGMGKMGGDPVVSAAMNPRVAEKIGLSQETRDQIKKIDMENREKVNELQEKTHAAMEKQATLMKAEKIDEAAVMSAIDELFDCRREMAKVQTKRLIAIKSLLTPEQLTKAVEEMKAFRENRKGKGPKGEGRRPVPPPEDERPVPPPEA